MAGGEGTPVLVEALISLQMVKSISQTRLISLDRPISTLGALEQSDAPSPLMSLSQLSMPSSALA